MSKTICQAHTERAFDASIHVTDDEELVGDQGAPQPVTLGVADAVVEPVDDDAKRVSVEVDLHVHRGVRPMKTSTMIG